MIRYKNLAGDSGVAAYEVGDTFIRVQFNDGSLYIYNYQSAGVANIEHMKSLAVAGRGLNTFIRKAVAGGYASKLRCEQKIARRKGAGKFF